MRIRITIRAHTTQVPYPPLTKHEVSLSGVRIRINYACARTADDGRYIQVHDKTNEVTDDILGSVSLTFHYTVDSHRDNRYRDRDAWPIRGKAHAPTCMSPLAPDKWGAADILDNDIQPMGARARATTEDLPTCLSEGAEGMY